MVDKDIRFSPDDDVDVPEENWFPEEPVRFGLTGEKIPTEVNPTKEDDSGEKDNSVTEEEEEKLRKVLRFLKYPEDKIYSVLYVSSKEFTEKDHVARLRTLLLQIYDLTLLFPDISSNTIINWSEVLFIGSEEAMKAEEMSPASTSRRLRWLAHQGDSKMAWAFLAFNVLALGLSILALSPLAISSSTSNMINAGSGTAWSGGDFFGGMFVALHQLERGENFQASVNIFSSLGLLATTLFADLGSFGVLQMSATTISALMGFSCAACMVVGAGMETLEVIKCNKRIRTMEEQLHRTKDPQQKELLYKTILIEKAHRENHKRMATAWVTCAVAVTALAVVSYLVLSGISFGAVPAATVALTAFVCVSAMIRKWWVNRVDHVSNLKSSIATTPNIVEGLHKLVDNNVKVYGVSLTEPIIPQTFGKSISIKDYLEKVLIKNPGAIRGNIEYLNAVINNKSGYEASATPEFVEILSKLKNKEIDAEPDSGVGLLKT